MEIAKWVILIIVIGLAIYLIVDTTLFIRKKIKEKKARQLEKQETNDAEQTHVE